MSAPTLSPVFMGFHALSSCAKQAPVAIVRAVSRWEDNWIVEERLQGGGQGYAYLVRRRDNDGERYFLKVLRNNNSERRNRMRREISCYETLQHALIPKLIDGNVGAFDEAGVTPYLVSEYIPGTNLERYVQRRECLPAAESFEIALKLLETVTYAHSQETVHRDIKPSNIVLRNERPSEPVLVDFGMSFYEGEDQLTEAAQEVGNRFLSLPEFSPGSPLKRDPRSDVTLCAGILLYMLTGRMPRDLRDHGGVPPHQSKAGREAMLRHRDIDLLALLDVFDRAFDLAIHARWDSADSLIAALKRVRIGAPNMRDRETPEQMLERLRAQLEGHEEQRLQRVRMALERARTLINEGRDAVLNQLPGLLFTSGGNYIAATQGKAGGMIGLVKASDERGYTPQYLVEVQGTEIVLSLDGAVFFRCPTEGLQAAAGEIRERARDVFLMGLRDQMQG